MKNLLTLLLSSVCYGAISTQIDVFPATGNVGIGTLSPIAKIETCPTESKSNSFIQLWTFYYKSILNNRMQLYIIIYLPLIYF